MLRYWHNPRCSKSREGLALLAAHGLEPQIVDYLGEPPSAARLKGLFKKLGGEGYLAHLEEAHEAYGRALHITAPKPESAPTGDVRAAFLTTLAALRDYAARVAAHADPDVPGSEEISAALLAPLAAWESRPAGSSSEASDAEEAPAAPVEAVEAVDEEPPGDPA